ncbi:MAG: alpha/beta fold hydrolase [Eubacteriales bacterium]|nr:alpha/beta fold hydrolase [Eubacteriales bacterium]
MEYTDFTLKSSTGTNALRCRKLIPDCGVRGVVQIIHGIGEHIERYDTFMAYLVSQGFAVCGMDLLGHGKTARDENGKGIFAPEDGWNYVVKDQIALRNRMKEDFPAVPFILFGHSMGSFLARTCLIDYPEAFDLAILSGTGHQSPLVLQGGCLLADMECRIHGPLAKGKRLKAAAFNSYCKKIPDAKTPYDWLTRDEEQLAFHAADPNCISTCKNGLYRDMLYGIRYITDKENIARMNKDCPVYFMSGAEDPVGDYGKGVEKAYQAFCKAGLKDVTIRLYPGGRHEMLNEINRAEVFEDIREWIEKHLR